MDIKDCVSQIEKKFDLVVSNPPYIKTEALNDLQPEILWYGIRTVELVVLNAQ